MSREKGILTQEPKPLSLQLEPEDKIILQFTADCKPLWLRNRPFSSIYDAYIDFFVTCQYPLTIYYEA